MNLEFREATEGDVPALVQLLADDALGAKREDVSLPLNTDYLDAFHNIEVDSNNELIVVESTHADYRHNCRWRLLPPVHRR